MATPIDPRTGLPLQGPPAPVGMPGSPLQGPPQVPQVGPAQTTLQVPPPVASTPKQPQRANPYADMPRMNPNRAMWTGIINDMANYIGSAGASGFQGLGNQYRQQALAHNMQRTGLMDEWERQRAADEAAARKANRPEIFGGETGGYYQYDPQTGKYSQITGGIGRQPSATQQKIALANNIAGTSDQSDPRWIQAWQSLSGAGDTNVNVTLPGEAVEPTSAVMTQLQKEIVGSAPRLQRFQRIAGDYRPEFLTYLGQAKNKLLAVGEKMGRDLTPDERQAVQGWTNFRQGVRQEFNDYRRLVTGAAASVQEMADLEQSYLNIDLSPTEFTASINRLHDELQTKTAMAYALMSGGFTSGAQLESAVDAAVAQGKQPYEIRASVLEAENPDRTAEDIEAQLISEGWLPGGQ